ncbi:glycoside hydrolase family 18 protein [Bipolaris maydis ATCC 48331]|uniref:chitinase n=2 Tax=Cochliobolus heterostrophus TaxID=5016 RepID=M2SYI2_COCH5|nr:glycoside hydrolase family 18 protein [Bipolaris maydis ATCC 48331]EMD85470.1 glycoside hydrolase family 18 protein [Bipolaris maydis C5]KAJ5023750.1 glycoside hydrolase [Bipolaris maydis]EMD90420.1 glycoside hydrolase family 18 protein [Bipolaris maydis C5]ENI09367.1 glycoside hydrolase family 18 protein [Bipolaris maydis ATCC 48331]KAJ5058308.1 glycoside hydrolase superfamily [Bipolaris maydis]
MRFTDAAALLSLSSLAQAAPGLRGHQHAHYSSSSYGSSSSAGYHASTFFINWGIYARNYKVTDLPAKQLTEVNYAFANVNNVTGEVVLSDEWADIQIPYPGDVAGNATLLGNFGALFKLKQQNRHLRVTLSIGGWSFRDNFKPAFSTEAGRQKFCDSSLELIKDLGIDGIDIDYEYPEDLEASANFADAVKRCRNVFDTYSAAYANNYRFIISISSPAGPQNYEIFPIAEMDPYVDYWNLMAFDYQGPGFSNFTGHNSNLWPSKTNPRSTDGWDAKNKKFTPFNTDRAIQYYKSKISSPTKIQLGMPLYGQAFANVMDPNPFGDGTGVKFNGSMPGSWQAGNYDYKVLPLNNSGTAYASYEVGAAWTYNRKTRDLVSFDTPQVAQWKTQYIKAQQLGGAWWWEASGDRPVTDPKSLVRTVVQALGGESALKPTENLLYFPQSKYVNVRNANATQA